MTLIQSLDQMGAHSSSADYARAERFLYWNRARYVRNADIQHHWIGAEDRFWYLRTKEKNEKEFVLVDAETGSSKPAFDHEKVAAGLSTAANVPVEAGALPFKVFRYTHEATAIQFEFANQLWTCQLKTSECQVAPLGAGPDESVSPDGRWIAFRKDHNVWIRPTSGGAAFPLTSDGLQHNGYAASPGSSRHAVSDIRHPVPRPLQVIWSADSRYLLSHRLDERQVKRPS